MAGIFRPMLGIVCLAILSIACKKDTKPQTPEAGIKVTPEVSGKGVSTGVAFTKQIGPAGGVLVSADQSCSITIPAGALNANTTIGLEPITNTNLAGKGTAWRLTPHGQQFVKPVAVRFSYAALADSISSPQMLGLSFQGSNGIWNFTGADAIDTEQKTVTYETRHFSDWALMEQISLAPYHADLDAGEKVKIRAMLFVLSENEDLLFPLTPKHPADPYSEAGYPQIGKPQLLPLKYIDEWSLSGPGKLTNGTGKTVEYQAPESISEITSATVSCKLKAPVQGTFILLCSIRLFPKSWIEFDVAGRGKVLVPASPVVRNGSQYLLSNPENEGGGYFSITWEGGLGAHAYDMKFRNSFHFITPQETYVSMYRPGIEDDLFPSGGSVNITHLGDGRVEGTFTVTNVGYSPTLVPTTSAEGKFKAVLFER